MNPRPSTGPTPRPKSRGFTLIELMVTLVILAIVAISLATIVLTSARSKTATMNNLESTQAARIATDMIAKDVRSAGFGADLISVPAQNPIAYVDAQELIVNSDMNPYPDTATVKGAPLAYNPASSPKPHPLNSTQWQPVKRYLTGAECIRWTLDVNNDGIVDADDVLDANGVDARNTPNPGDYVLVRQVYGDSTGAVAGNNGGTMERIALVAKPGGSVPPIFTVYLNNSADAWDWTNGPVPAAQLQNITRVTVNVTSESSKPDWRHQYARTKFKSDVSTLRNTPDFGTSMYDVDGYVFHDKNRNYVRDNGEPGLAGAAMQMGIYSTVTDGTGYYYLHVPPGSYTLKHQPPTGFGVYTSPDTFIVALGPDAVRTFADTSKAGGTVNCFAFLDKDGNGTFDNGQDEYVTSAQFTLSPTNQNVLSDANGNGSLFAPVGGYTVACTAPDSLVVTSTNPVSGTMTNGGTASYQFALKVGGFGFVEGTVYKDTNRNGLMDGGETGIANTLVIVTPDAGTTVPGYDYSNTSGQFKIKVPMNDPPHSTAYACIVVPPGGYYPTSATTIPSLWIQDGQTINDNNFGMSSFQVINLTASRVLSLATADMVEKDWPGTSVGLAVQDNDLVLGADAAGTDQISTWFNQYNGSPLFTASPTYTRSAPQSVLSMSVDTLDGSAPKTRPDLVTGTKVVAAGNFFAWFTQNTSGNEGTFPTTYSASQNYKTTDAGDVQAVRTYDCAGGSGADYPDIIVGTKSPTPGIGSIEVWKSSNAATPTFSRDEVYPTAGGLGAGTLGEVTSMILADMDNDGKRDLVVGTSTGAYSGQVVLFKFVSKSTLPHFLWMNTISFPNDIVTAVTAVDVDVNGNKDLVIGTQRSSSSGKLMYLQSVSPALFTFNLKTTRNAPGIVTSMLTADFGGTSANDVLVGFRDTAAGYGGGCRIYYLDQPDLPNNGTDPSGGTLNNFVAAITAGNFNYGVQPPASAPYLMDLAAGVKTSATAGALVVFIR